VLSQSKDRGALDAANQRRDAASAPDEEVA